MTLRLYYTDSTCARFSARVIEQLTWDGQPAVLLDRTAFYPTSGGQPADRGTLDDVAVVDVLVRERDDAIVHVLERALPQGTVDGVIDWPRRFDHMQQHTGQHILSAAFEQLLDADTVGFHLGAETSTVDIDAARLEPEAVVPAEDLANRVVWENHPVLVRSVDPHELSALPLSRPPAVEGPVRLVEVADFDVNPCGGTHVAHTGEIGSIKILRLDYRGDETRVEFVCGGRCLRDYRAKNDMAYRLASLLTVGHWELDQAVTRLQVEAKQLRQELRRARKRLLQVDAAELVTSAAAHGPYRTVVKVCEELDGSELRALAQAVVQSPGLVALLSSVGERAHFCFACADDVDLDMALLLREACAQLGGRGGGQAHLAQGSTPMVDAARIEAVLHDLLPDV